MFFRKDKDIQRLNLEAPKPEPVPPVDPARLEAVNQRAQQILDSGAIPEWLFLCTVGNGLLTYLRGPGQKPVVLLFSSPFAATDYLRATNTKGEVRQVKVEALQQAAQSWLTSGAGEAAIDRCPRCAQFLCHGLEAWTKYAPADFAKVWAYHRAVRVVMGGLRVRSAMAHMASANHAAARADLEYIRDHFDCGVPYLHQAIGLISGVLQDEPAKAAALERLKEFGPQFAGSLEFSPELWATVLVGLGANFGVLNLR